ncbi:MAG: hypothetical protein J3Q66DRAFT_393860 [Benniella sp.]|nr:MAG: hypothetical protein J3Q66DRAFT_393860 [Benniella sp.]
MIPDFTKTFLEASSSFQEIGYILLAVIEHEYLQPVVYAVFLRGLNSTLYDELGALIGVTPEQALNRGSELKESTEEPVVQPRAELGPCIGCDARNRGSLEGFSLQPIFKLSQARISNRIRKLMDSISRFHQIDYIQLVHIEECIQFLSEISELTRTLKQRQSALHPDNTTVLDRAIIEHNYSQPSRGVNGGVGGAARGLRLKPKNQRSNRRRTLLGPYIGHKKRYQGSLAPTDLQAVASDFVSHKDALGIQPSFSRDRLHWRGYILSMKIFVHALRSHAQE